MPKEQKNTKQGTGAQPLEHYTDRLRILHEIDLAILEARSLDAISEAVLGTSNQLFPNCEWACVTLFDTSVQGAIVLAARSDKFTTFKSNERLPLESFRVASNSSQQPDTYIVGNLHDIEQPTFAP